MEDKAMKIILSELADRLLREIEANGGAVSPKWLQSNHTEDIAPALKELADHGLIDGIPVQ
jgi:hypothetical protein